MTKTFDDIRGYIKLLEKKKELVRVKREVDPILEINAIIDRLVRAEGPAVLFENVKGSKIPVLGNTFGSMKRISWAFGSDDLADSVGERMEKMMGAVSSDSKDLLFGLRTKGLKTKAHNFSQLLSSPGMLKAMSEILKSLSVMSVELPREKAPCKEVVLTGDDIDLDKFPLLKLWPKDGGRFITLPLVITRDIENARLNVGIYRMMQLDKKSLCMHWLPLKHGAIQYSKYEEMDMDMPVAVAVGADPALEICGMFPLVGPIDEYMLAGFLKGSPVKYTKAEDSDLWVPAGAEIVFEGIVRPCERAVEGPFGEFNGYYSPVKETPIFHVNKITMRRDPIWHAATTGKPTSEIHYFTKTIERLGVVLMKAAVPMITDMNMTKESGTLYTMIVSINKTRPNQARELINIFHAMGPVIPQLSYLTTVVVVDSEVNVHDLSEVLWAFSNNCRPEHDVIITEQGVADLEKPCTTPRGIGARMGIDATRKLLEENMDRPFPDLVEMDEAIENKVDLFWKDYGFKS